MKMGLDITQPSAFPVNPNPEDSEYSDLEVNSNTECDCCYALAIAEPIPTMTSRDYQQTPGATNASCSQTGYVWVTLHEIPFSASSAVRKWCSFAAMA